MFDPYLSCTYINIYFIFSNGKEKGGLRTCPCIIHDSSCDSGPAISLLHFKICLSNHKEKCLLNALLTFQPVDVPSFFILSMFPNLCWHILKKKIQKIQKKKTQRGVLVDFSIFFEALFSQDKTKLFSQYNKKRNYMCIELVNIQKFYFLFPLEELHFV